MDPLRVPSIARGQPGPAHLYELDVVRVVACACVVAVHVVSHTARGQGALVGSLIVLHFTREVFFALSAFVLSYTALSRPRPLRRFWAHRFLLVGIPYLVWSVAYSVVKWADHPVALPTFLTHLGLAIVTGTAFYHLYYLLVLMQLYLLLPLLLRLVRATRGRHRLIVGIALAVQVTISAFDAYAPGSLHWLNIVTNVVNYLGFIVAGAVAADHARALLAWVRTRRGPVLVVCLVAGVLTIAVYAVQLAAGFSSYRAATAYQPVVIVWAFVLSLGLLALGTWWVDRHPDPEHPGLSYLSDRSFGVYLAHPLILWTVLRVTEGWRAVWPPTLMALFSYPLVVVGALLVTDIARRTPLSLPLSGRPRTDPTSEATTSAG